jgi:antitoxin CptB
MALSQIERLKMLRLACRRGNSETESLLMAYWQNLFAMAEESGLNETRLTQFERLLQVNDQDLMQWCLRPDTAPEAWQPMLEAIRAAYRNASESNVWPAP